MVYPPTPQAVARVVTTTNLYPLFTNLSPNSLSSNILSSNNLPQGKYFKDSVLSDVSVPNYESRIMEEEKAGFNFQVTEERDFSSNQKIRRIKIFG